MIDIEKIVQRACDEQRLTAPVLAAPFDLQPASMADLTAKGVISGFVADGQDAAARFPDAVVGWWTDRQRADWKFALPCRRPIVFLGPEAQIGGRMLLSAARAGVRDIFVTSDSSGVVRRVPVLSATGRRATLAIVRKASGNRLIGPSVMASLSRAGRTSFEEAYEQFSHAIGDRLRLDPERFVADRALLIVGTLGPGGAERQAATTAIGLEASGRWRASVGCSHLDGDASFHKARIEASGVAVEEIPLTPPEMSAAEILAARTKALDYQLIDFHNLAHLILSYAFFIRRHRPALVQCWMDQCNVLAGLAAELVGVPALVVSGRSMAPDNFGIHQPYMRPGYFHLLKRRPDVIFTNNSRAGAADYARWLRLPADRFQVIHNGFDFPERPTRADAEGLKAELGIPAAAPVVGSVIRFSEEKRPDLWIETAERILERHEKAYFVVFGTGPMLEGIRSRVAARGLKDRIKLPGLTREVWKALVAMDVFMLTSRLEGLPNVLIEAQCMGLPVVTTGHGGMTETYVEGKTGLTARPDSATGLAEAVVRLLKDDELRRTMSSASREHAIRHFSNEAMLAATHEIFEIACARQQAPSA